MILRYILTYLTILCAVLMLTGLFILANFGRVDAIEGATRITDVLVCEGQDCTPTTPATLPYFTPKQTDADRYYLTFRAIVPSPDDQDDHNAIYIPKIADHVGMAFNGVMLLPLDESRRYWAEPQLVDIPTALLDQTENTIDIVVSGRLAEGLELYPVYIGPRDVLRPVFLKRFASGPGFARFNLAFLIVLGLTYILVWMNRRDDRRYMWLALSCACGCILLLQFGYGVLWGGYKFWVGLTHLAVAFFALFMMKFVSLQIGLAEMRVERVLFRMLVAGTVLFAVIPSGFLQFWALGLNILTAVAAGIALTIYWVHRKRVERLDFVVIFTCMLLAKALGAHEMVLVHSPSPDRSFHLFHFVPVCMSLVFLWVIVTQLIRSLRSYETLTDSLNETIALKTHALEKSFNKLAKVERREAIDRERNRIMLDLHDGIGGQLVSTLAYMESSGHSDKTLKEALEAALRDLALVLDSLDSHDSLTTLLGMLRTRLEPLLSAHGLAFKWQITDDPEVPQAGPSSNLHLARIVQEAITNVIKHAQAKTITVYTDADTIVISDDGVGIDEVCITPGGCAGHGLDGMRHRAESIGAAFDIRRTAQGTSVRLSFGGANAQPASAHVPQPA